jgi:hypothetical protein
MPQSNDKGPKTQDEHPVETIIIAYRDASDPSERRFYLRAAHRRLAHDAALLATRLELLAVATASEARA